MRTTCGRPAIPQTANLSKSKNSYCWQKIVKAFNQWRSERFKRGGKGGIISIFSSVFLCRTYLKLIEKQEKLYGGPGACSPVKFFESLHAVMAILVLFE